MVKTRVKRERRQVRRTAELFAAGHTPEAIARITGQSPETVQKVLERILGKATIERRSS